MDGKLYLRKYTRGFLPLVVDLETSGSDFRRHGVLEIAAIFPSFIDNNVCLEYVFHRYIELDDENEIDADASIIHGIPIGHPFLYAVNMRDALNAFSDVIKNECEKYSASRGIIVGHNPSFDMSFLDHAMHKYDICCHLHKYTFIDTASIGLVKHRETVLARLCQKEKLGFDHSLAHSAMYDAFMTAKLFWSFMGFNVKSKYEDLIVL